MTSNKFLKILRTTCFTLISLSIISFPTVSQAGELLRLAISLCESAKVDDRSGMRKKLKSAKVRLRLIYSGITCGSTGSLLRVATMSGSLQAATFIATKIGKKKLGAGEEPDGKTIIQWTQSLVLEGDAGKQAFIDLYNSKL